MRIPPSYDEVVRCPACHEMAVVVPLLNEFNYSGTHCNHGRAGVHYPDDWGRPVTECCGEEIEL